MSFYNILLFILLIFNFQTQHHYIDSLIDNKQYMVAEKVIINSIKENPNNQILIKKLGDCYGFIKDWDNAIIQYQKLIELDSDNSVYNYKLGGTLAAKANETNRFKSLSLINKSKKYLLKSVELDNKNKPAMWVLVQIYTELPQLLGGSKLLALEYASELENISVARKSIVAFKKIKKGEIFTTKNLTTKRPGNGLSPMFFNHLLGKKSEKNFKENDKIRVRKI